MAIAVTPVAQGRKNHTKKSIVAGSAGLLAAALFIFSAKIIAGVPRVAAGAPTLPAGTVLYLRLQSAVSTKTSQPGQSINASLARELDLNGGTALPFGTTLAGALEKCDPPAAPEQRADVLLEFNQLNIPGEGNFGVEGRVTSVSNARESYLADGTVVGVLASEAYAPMLGGVFQKVGQINPTVNSQIQKQRIGEVNTEIEFPPGTDIQFTLTRSLALRRFVASAGPRELPANLRDAVAGVLANAPQRTTSRNNKPGDPINLVFIGTAQEIEQAFHEAAWTQPRSKNAQSIWRTMQAVLNNDGYDEAPVSELFLFGRKEDLVFEKVLDTFNKRHHLRLWQTPTTAPDGRPIWLAAATHDVGIDYSSGSHATDPNLDDERAQVSADLWLGGGVQAEQLIAPPNPLSSGTTATGGEWHTDGNLDVIDIKP